MRSDLIFGALTHVTNRYKLCQLASKATRKLHKPNTRLQDTTNEVLDRFKDTVPMDLTDRRWPSPLPSAAPHNFPSAARHPAAQLDFSSYRSATLYRNQHPTPQQAISLQFAAAPRSIFLLATSALRHPRFSVLPHHPPRNIPSPQKLWKLPRYS